MLKKVFQLGRRRRQSRKPINHKIHPTFPHFNRRFKTLSGKAAADECTGGVPSGYVEDAFEARTQLDGVFSRRQKRK